MLEFLDTHGQRGVKSSLGVFLGKYSLVSSDGRLLSVQELSRLNLFNIAEAYINKHTYNGTYPFHGFYTLTREYELYELENDIVELIDLYLPFHYFRQLHGFDNEEARKHYTGIEVIEGLKFRYAENYERERERLEYFKKW